MSISGGSRPLLQAILRQNHKKVTRILQRRCRPLYISAASMIDQTVSRCGSPALHCAATLCTRVILRILLEHGASPNVRDDSARTALHNADSVAVLTQLMTHGADPYMQDQIGHLPIHTFARNDHRAKIEALVRDWKVPINVRAANGNTALHFAESARCARLLLDLGADPSPLNEKGRTPLTEALMRTPVILELAQTLYARGGYWCCSPLLEMRYLYRDRDVLPTHMIAWLIEAGVDVMERNYEGETALFVTVKYSRDLRSVALLLRAGADPNDGLHASVCNPQDPVFTLLIAAGGRSVDQATFTPSQWRAARETLGVCKIR